MSIYYAKALFIYFWKPVLLIFFVLSAAVVADVASKRWRQSIVIKFDDGALEALKWLSAFIMLIDHINKYLLEGAYPLVFNVGRVVMPVFGVIFAYNLARSPGVSSAVLWRLVVFGLLACVPLFLLQDIKNWLPLNILISLLLSALIINLLNRRGWYVTFGIFLFVFGGFIVEYWWPGVAVVVGSYYFFKNRSFSALAICLIGMVLLYPINNNFWALASIPLIAACFFIKPQVNRFKWFFYWFYPVHLMVVYFFSIIFL